MIWPFSISSTVRKLPGVYQTHQGPATWRKATTFQTVLKRVLDRLSVKVINMCPGWMYCQYMFYNVVHIYVYTHVYVYTHCNTFPAFEPESETYGMCLNERIFSGRHRPMCPFVGDSFPVAPWDSSPLGTQWTRLSFRFEASLGVADAETKTTSLQSVACSCPLCRAGWGAALEDNQNWAENFKEQIFHLKIPQICVETRGRPFFLWLSQPKGQFT